MSPVYLNPQHSSTSIPFLDLIKGSSDQQHDHVTSTNIINNNSYFSSSNLGYHHAPTNFLGMDYSRSTQDKVVEKLILSHDHKSMVYPFDNIQDQGNYHNNLEIIKTTQKPQKCKPPKLKIMQKAITNTAKPKKMIGEHHGDHLVQPNKQINIYGNSSKEANNNGIRMCSNCHTTTTPLWRSGPNGPKSLCNACGIRQRKARRAAAMAAAIAAAIATQVHHKDNVVIPLTSSPTSITSTTTFEAPPPPKPLVVEENYLSHTLPLKKRCKTYNNDYSYNNEENNSSQRMLPRDEEEGAILLMALSCGLA